MRIIVKTFAFSFFATVFSTLVYRDEYGDLVRYDGHKDQMDVYQNIYWNEDFPKKFDENFPIQDDDRPGRREIVIRNNMDSFKKSQIFSKDMIKKLEKNNQVVKDVLEYAKRNVMKSVTPIENYKIAKEGDEKNFPTRDPQNNPMKKKMFSNMDELEEESMPRKMVSASFPKNNKNFRNPYDTPSENAKEKVLHIQKNEDVENVRPSDTPKNSTDVAQPKPLLLSIKDKETENNGKKYDSFFEEDGFIGVKEKSSEEKEKEALLKKDKLKAEGNKDEKKDDVSFQKDNKDVLSPFFDTLNEKEKEKVLLIQKVENVKKDGEKDERKAVDNKDEMEDAFSIKKNKEEDQKFRERSHIDDNKPIKMIKYRFDNYDGLIKSYSRFREGNRLDYDGQSLDAMNYLLKRRHNSPRHYDYDDYEDDDGVVGTYPALRHNVPHYEDDLYRSAPRLREMDK